MAGRWHTEDAVGIPFLKHVVAGFGEDSPSQVSVGWGQPCPIPARAVVGESTALITISGLLLSAQALGQTKGWVNIWEANTHKGRFPGTLPSPRVSLLRLLAPHLPQGWC